MSEQIYRWMMYRLYSFLRYPEAAFFRPPELSILGFYSSGRGEEVTCYACGVSHTHFQPGQSIRSAHMQRSLGCPLNVNGDALQADDANAAENVVPPQDHPIPLPNVGRPIGNRSIRYYSWERQTNVAFRRSKPNFRLLVAEGIRLRRYTFYDWPGDHGDREELASRGLFYTGTLDKVQCCSCGKMYTARNLQTVPRLREAYCLISCRCYFE